jgi:ParB/RepB/Spo0J family partition protein
MATAIGEPTRVVDVRYVPLKALVEHPLNPRKHFNEAFLAELAQSLRTKGVLTPLLVRPWDVGVRRLDTFQVLAGHQRLRAAHLAELREVPVIVRELDDDAALELMIIDNLQRADVHPLDEASGYASLMKSGYDVAHIAGRVGRSIKYVYDRVKLLELTPELQEHFLADRITAGHAILLARLDPKDQARTNKLGALWNSQQLLWNPEELGGRDYDSAENLKSCSVRELEAWIDEHVRLEAAALDTNDLQMQFPAVAEVLAKPIEEQPEKIVPITYQHMLAPEVKGDERTLTCRSWKRADGSSSKAKACDQAVTGVVVVGYGRGEAFKVCTAKEKCRTHWGSEIREKAKRAEGRTSGSKASEDGWKARQEADNRRYEEQRRKDEAERARWKKAAPAILNAVAARVMELKADATGLLAQMLIDDVRSADRAPQLVARGKTSEDLVRHLAFLLLADEALDDWRGPREFPRRAKALGVDVKKILAAADKPVDEKKPAKGKPVAKASKRGATAQA